jgi:tetratricopeptide (TPR) repeat protein
MTVDLSVAERHLKGKSSLILLVAPGSPYDVGRSWGPFDTIGIRALDDLWFSPDSPERRLLLLDAEPAHAQSVIAVAFPVQVALERAYFHLQGVQVVSIDGDPSKPGLSPLQDKLDFTRGNTSSLDLSRQEIAELIGRLELGSGKKLAAEGAAESALRRSSYFEALARARAARVGKNNPGAWWVELFALTHLGLADEAMALYEAYPERGSAQPEAQLVAARFRVLLKQLNEARTILVTVKFDDRLRTLALVELARSYLMTEDYGRALDIVQGAVTLDPELVSARLVRGLAKRGLSYSAGEEDGLSEALEDFQWVSREGGVDSAEALFHSSTVLARLGRLEEAELSIRQSLFQRDRLAARDALIRLLCATGRIAEAREELELLKLLQPGAWEPLAAHVEDAASSGSSSKPSGAVESPLWSGDKVLASTEAKRLIESWKVPLSGSLADFSFLDDWIDFYAPAGHFTAGLEHSSLNEAGLPVVARTLAVHLAGVLETAKLAAWSAERPLHIALPSGTMLPLESFVHDRLLLGASGDNLSSLASLLIELPGAVPPDASYSAPRVLANDREIREYERESEWAASKITALGGTLSGAISDLSELDRVFDITFDAGGEIRSGVTELTDDDIDRFIRAAGLLVGRIISSHIPAKWYAHPDAAGIALSAFEIGFVFPVARTQRRIMLAAGADYGTRLTSLGLSCAVARALVEVKEGGLKDAEAIKMRLLELLPAFAHFDERELEGLARTLLERK